MTTFPLNLFEEIGHPTYYIVFLLIGFGFGFVLEMAGFGNSKKLASQFYFKDMTVLKVMFGAILVAMSLIFLSSAVGLLDYELVWVNPTYLIPGIVGGLIMGVGFIIGGFCPGTSLVAASTFKLDGVFFLMGVLFGVFVFGESVGSFDSFFNSAHTERLTLPGWLGVDTGLLVLGMVVMGLIVFLAAEKLEKIFGDKEEAKEKPVPGSMVLGRPRWQYAAVGSLLVVAVAGAVIGQPTNEDLWNRVADEKQPLLDSRDVHIHPVELESLMGNDAINLIMLDVRSADDYAMFHLPGAEREPNVLNRLEALEDKPANSVFLLISNDEKAATRAWKQLVAEGLPNVYILDGGINYWLDIFTSEGLKRDFRNPDHANDAPAYIFDQNYGADHPAATNPELPMFVEIDYDKKIEVEAIEESGESSPANPAAGGCG